MKEVTIRGQVYRTGRLDVFAQMYVVKRAAPVLGKLQSLAASFDEADPERSLALLGEAVGALPDEALGHICNAALDVVEMRQAGGGWAPVRKNGALMYPDMELLTMLSLVAHVLQDNLSGFFRDLPALASPDAASVNRPAAG